MTWYDVSHDDQDPPKTQKICVCGTLAWETSPIIQVVYEAMFSDIYTCSSGCWKAQSMDCSIIRGSYPITEWMIWIQRSSSKLSWCSYYLFRRRISTRSREWWRPLFQSRVYRFYAFSIPAKIWSYPYADTTSRVSYHSNGGGIRSYLRKSDITCSNFLAYSSHENFLRCERMSLFSCFVSGVLVCVVISAASFWASFVSKYEHTSPPICIRLELCATRHLVSQLSDSTTGKPNHS